jgi:hypothetical protein
MLGGIRNLSTTAWTAARIGLQPAAFPLYIPDKTGEMSVHSNRTPRSARLYAGTFQDEDNYLTGGKVRR